MTLHYCLVESGNKLDKEWEFLVKLICTDIQEAYDLLDAYEQDHFDICEFRLVPCTREVFNQHPELLTLESISYREQKHGRPNS